VLYRLLEQRRIAHVVTVEPDLPAPPRAVATPPTRQP
jgi:hypothetical protein